MKFFDPEDTSVSVHAKIELANQLEDIGVLSEWSYVKFLNTGKLNWFDSLRYYIKERLF